MAFTILNEADAFNANQSEPDRVDFQILEMGANGQGVISGCAVSAQGSPDMTVAVAIGLIRVGTLTPLTQYVPSGNVTITAAHSTLPRIDLIVVDNVGNKSAVAGTAAAEPACPNIPANSIVLAMVYVPAADTTIAANQITDKRILVPHLPVVIRKTSDETVTSSSVLQTDNDFVVDLDINSVWAFQLFVFVDSGSVPDFKASFSAINGTTLWHTATNWSGGATLLADGATTPIATTTGDRGILFIGKVVMNSTPDGGLLFQWSQNTSDPGNTTVRANSYMILTKLV